MPRREGFLRDLMNQAKENGHSIYEELQGGSVIRSAQADWNGAIGVLADTLEATGKDIEHLFKVVHPTIDSTPDRHTLEDVIDPIIFDPQSSIAPLELMALGVSSTSRFAAAGAKAAARKVGFMIDDAIGLRRAASEGTKAIVKEAAPAVAKRVDDVVEVTSKAKSKVVEGMKHSQYGASPEAMAREARGEIFYRISPSGKATQIISGGEDAAMKAAERTKDAIVRVVGKGNYVPEGGAMNAAQDAAAATLKPGKVRDITAKTHKLIDEPLDEAEELMRSLGIQPGRGPKPPRRP